MNKTVIKNFAIWARVQLIESAKQRAFEYEITENGENKPNVEAIGGRLLTADEKKQRSQLISQIRDKGYTQVMEEAAYTWFNRFVALRFMEVNGYLPSKIRVFTDENNAFKPEIMKEAMRIELDGLDKTKVLKLLDEQNNEELYKYLLITQCNALGEGLPYVFEKVANWTELLFPNNLLKEDSVIGKMISDIDVDDWSDEVEIIGWLYQYYISEKHEEVVDPLHGKTVKKEDIPAATQLFTTDWVVRYILDNSLGRYWIERHPESQLAEKLTYFVIPKDGKLETVNESIKPEELKVLDPCVGSGHFLSYAFDVLMEIYRESGWSDRDAAKSIIENNLFGLDIDDRASQLACFAVMMKARKYNRKIISSDTNLHIMAMQDSTGISDELIKFVAKHDDSIRKDLNELRTIFNNAKEYGSIINVPKIDFRSLYMRIDEIKSEFYGNILDMALQNDVVEKLLPLVRQAEILFNRYDVVATNPPYLSRYSTILKNYINEKYEAYKGDLFSVFIYRNFGFCKPNGYSGLMTPMVWMFIRSYEDLRNYIICNKSIATLIQFEYSAFEEATVPICAFVLKNGRETSKGIYFKLSEFRGGMETQKNKVIEALLNPVCGYYYEAYDVNFRIIPGTPIAYWVGPKVFNSFSEKRIGDYITTREGMATADNNRFLRLWFELSKNEISFNCSEDNSENVRWVPYNKGGEFRKWYGNNDYVVFWENEGYEIKNNRDPQTGRIRSHNYNGEYSFREGATWSALSSGGISLRFCPKGYLFDSKGAKGFSNGIMPIESFMALVNSKIGAMYLSFFSPTIDFKVGDVILIPVFQDNVNNEKIQQLAYSCIEYAKCDWDSFETSWDFTKNPIVPLTQNQSKQEHGSNITLQADKFGLISWHYQNWSNECNERFNQLKFNEEELNRIFINIYGLQDELTPDVADNDITIRRAELTRDVKNLISYAVGCMFGRYSVDEEGLCYAGGEWDVTKYFTIIPDSDNIIPICDDDYFDDDIVGKFVDFVRKVYGDETLEQNLRFIADALGGKGTPREVIRNYFINDFFADHCNTYSVTGSGKRPIYWLFSSGKKNGFKALVYIHRYQPDLLARMRTDYVHEQQERYRTQLQMLEDSVLTAAPSERIKLNKQIAKLKEQSLEIQKYEEKIHHLADQMILIDLDDGVKANYDMLQDVLERIK